MSNYIQTYSGTRVHHPFNNPLEILTTDIAHSLSQQCRFTGHLHQFWSIAQHSLCVADLVPDEHKKQALLHDATEAYLCDIPTPFKVLMPEYMRMEKDMWELICERYDLPVEMHPSVKEADRILLMTERDAFNPNNRDWSEEYENTPRSFATLGQYILMPPQEVRAMFLERFKEYCGV